MAKGGIGSIPPCDLAGYPPTRDEKIRSKKFAKKKKIERKIREKLTKSSKLIVKYKKIMFLA